MLFKHCSANLSHLACEHLDSLLATLSIMNNNKQSTVTFIWSQLLILHKTKQLIARAILKINARVSITFDEIDKNESFCNTNFKIQSLAIGANGQNARSLVATEQELKLENVPPDAQISIVIMQITV